MPAPLREAAVRYLIVHCTNTGPKVRLDRNALDRQARERGWFGIGYHYVIRRDGALEVGRPLNHVGAHLPSHNESSIGIVMVGGADASGNAEDNFTPEQYATLASTLYTLLVKFPKARICGRNELDPKSTSPSFDVPKWWHETVVDPQVGK